MTSKVEAENRHRWAVAESLKVPPDELRCRLDFHHQLSFA